MGNPAQRKAPDATGDGGRACHQEAEESLKDRTSSRRTVHTTPVCIETSSILQITTGHQVSSSEHAHQEARASLVCQSQTCLRVTELGLQQRRRGGICTQCSRRPPSVGRAEGNEGMPAWRRASGQRGQQEQTP